MDYNQVIEEIANTKKIYEKILTEYVNLNNIFNLSNPLEIYTLYTILLHNGYFSKKHKFSVSENNQDLFNFKEFRAADVISGKGVCRHTTEMLKDIYTFMNINNEILSVYFYEENEALENHPFGNHVINLVSFENRVYYVDVMNILVWDKVNQTTLICFERGKMRTCSIPSWIDIADYNDFCLNSVKNIENMLSLKGNFTKEDDLILKRTK